ncbi:MAG: type I restriction-modification enzyme R subunit C-terminal domain-containing protein [Euzebya sp.]
MSCAWASCRRVQDPPTSSTVRQAGSFGLFIRSLVGLDRVAAKAAFADFLDDKRYSRNQIHFVNLIIDELTARGVLEARRVYESPYDGVAPEGPEVIFVEGDLDRRPGKAEVGFYCPRHCPCSSRNATRPCGPRSGKTPAQRPQRNAQLMTRRDDGDAAERRRAG